MNDQRTERQQRIDTWLAFLRAHSRVTAALEEELETAESLAMNWFDVLEQLQTAPDQELRMQELGEMLAMSASGLSRRISRMEQAGLVERKPCPDDRRGVLVVLTSAGRQRYRRALPVHLRGVERHFLDNLDRHESEVLEMVLSRILAKLSDDERAAAVSPSPARR